MIKSFISVLFIVCFQTVFSQNSTSSSWAYYEEISELLEVKPSEVNYTLVNIADWTEKFFQLDVIQSINPQATWKILFKQYEYTEEVIGQPLPTKNYPKDKYGKILTSNQNYYTSKELLQNFTIDQTLFSHDLIAGYPQIYERKNELNGEWIPYQSNNSLVLRYVHSYPNGNMTSFYKEILLYFERVE